MMWLVVLHLGWLLLPCVGSLSLQQGLSVLDASFSEDISAWGPCDLLLFAPHRHDEELEVGRLRVSRKTDSNFMLPNKGLRIPVDSLLKKTTDMIEKTEAMLCTHGRAEATRKRDHATYPFPVFLLMSIFLIFS